MVVFDKSDCTVLYLFKMFNLGSDVARILHWMGHATTKQTMNVYIYIYNIYIYIYIYIYIHTHMYIYIYT